MEVKRKSVKNAFRSIGDYVHAFLGFLSCLVNALPYGWIPSIAIMLVFVVYEALQTEKPVDSYCDIVEFLVGYAFAVPLLFLM